MPSRFPGVAAGLALMLLAGCRADRPTLPAGETGTPAASPPNLIVIVVDDQRWDELGIAGHPYLETPNLDRLAREGAWFANAFHAVPLCSPNRATLLTGQNPSTHGIIDNVARSVASHRLRTFPQALQRQGYTTGFFGKWHMGNDPTPRPGFDTWVALPGQGRSENPEFFEDGRLHRLQGYTTDLLTDRTIAFIEHTSDQPFLVYLAHKAIHPDVTQLDDGSVPPESEAGYVPAPRHLDRYAGRVFPLRANAAFDREALAGKPVLQEALALLDSAREVAPIPGRPPRTEQLTIERRAEMLLAVDEGLGRIMDTLERLGILDRTLILVTSDNGFFYDEHALTTERRLPYEESIRNVLLIRYPPLVSPGLRPLQLVSTLDVAPTLLDVAGAPIDPHVQGRSLVPVLRGQATDWRDAVLIEFSTYENPFLHLTEVDYRAVRTDRYKYIHWLRYPEWDELYDLERDPYELDNRIADPALRSVADGLRTRLGELVLEAMHLDRGR